MSKDKKNIFNMYNNFLKERIHIHIKDLKHIINSEYKDIQISKQTNYSDNYMFNDRISNRFYTTLGFSKTDLKNIIEQNMDKTKFANYRSSDPNNLLLQFIMRYALETKDNALLLLTYEIFGYKLFYPEFVRYFRYGIDEAKFKMYTTTLNNKSHLGKQHINTIYDAIDETLRICLNTYKDWIVCNDESKFFLFPVNTRTRINNFLNSTYNGYSNFLKKDKSFLNASLEVENKEDGHVFNTQTSNDNSESLYYKNQLELLLIQSRDLEEPVFNNILNYHTFKKNKYGKINKERLYTLYNRIIKSEEYNKRLVNLFIEYKTEHISLSNKVKMLSSWIKESLSRSSKRFILLDKLILEAIPEYSTLSIAELMELRMGLLFLLFEYYKRIK